MQQDRDRWGKFTVTEAALEDRRAKVWNLRVEGCNFREIGKRLEIDAATAYRDFKAVYDRTLKDTNATADEERRVSLERIDYAIQKLMPALDGEDYLNAMDRLDKLEKRRAALLGLDAPVRRELTGRDGGPIGVASIGLDEIDRLKAAAESNETCAPSNESEPSS